MGMLLIKQIDFSLLRENYKTVSVGNNASPLVEIGERAKAKDFARIYKILLAVSEAICELQ